ncbi:MAG: hypothetical protein P1Q69_01540 [Candidatus Thorarchaeota archaeon]|nr:hypothetical protein [Candidatus Thorarchaeota archaeon]
MKIFESLISAKKHGQQLAKEGQVPSIYQRNHCEFVLTTTREIPPLGAFPFMKWVGRDILLTDESEWVPILAQLDSLARAKEACALLYLLGHDPIIVEYRSIGTYDIFLRECDIPQGAWIVSDTDDDYCMFELQQPPLFYDEDDAVEFEVLMRTE